MRDERPNTDAELFSFPDEPEPSEPAPEKDQIGEYILAQIKEGAGRWEMPWHRGLKEAKNGVTGATFQGQNAIILWAEGMKRGYWSEEWATLRQWNRHGGRVRRGAKGVRVYRPVLHTKSDQLGEPSSTPHGFRHYTVFNYQDVNGVDHEHPDLFSDMAPQRLMTLRNEAAERIVAATRANIRYGGDNACYVFSEDCIYMPLRKQFQSSRHASASENFYATLLHELVHWTKPSLRCGRTEFSDNPTESYAFEELVAELGAAVLNTRFHKLPAPRQDHAAYLQGWLEILGSDFSYFYKAMGLAQIASDWLCRRAGLNEFLSEPLPTWHMGDYSITF
ncbi:DUF1738 domain-containing protein [Thiohalocapsa marina]|uniref:DUF1738 domain-containing protein n=1 Tax=Thiohalocapsa marina TaxID=424902 RepID=A0A5M8FQ47_9GAMM|nr:zincin-like metallopeptidase domain-containing protein [Thiohalocapsa marina]KAA6185281.1 DUF1738 domain-containing protein [Thiohalocapsa marina]